VIGAVAIKGGIRVSGETTEAVHPTVRATKDLSAQDGPFAKPIIISAK
jgi:hypothetical protein